MAVYRPKYRHPKTGELVASGVWWYEFMVGGKRIRESAKTILRSVAEEVERKRRRELEGALAGVAKTRAKGTKRRKG